MRSEFLSPNFLSISAEPEDVTSQLEITAKCVKEPTKIVGICIDSMTNNLASREITVFIYHEDEGGKGANEVCTMLNWYTENKIDRDVRTLYLFGDNCAGQNKNNTLVRMMMVLGEIKRFKDIKVTFPIRGHSFMPNDRDFGIIRRKLRKDERYYTVDEVAELIKHSSKNPN
ncbi:hypothetical protein PR048_007124 [Dryococelus australis]|uniref:DUF7869 domain-containing protein n=1 Tax=Dryococelus australis TaxID=614101 RepID=A0ABQ9ICR4_9NEOP|nr:hypothetical protein PR048_007124 [Dryococelus australis]